MTTKTFRRMRALYDMGRTDTQIAMELKVSLASVTNWRLREGLPRNLKPGGCPRKLYFVYRAATDELLAMGTALECARGLGISRDSFYSAVSRDRHGKRFGYKIIAEGLHVRDDEPDGAAGEGP